MTTYWCELAWLGGDRAEPNVVLEVDRDRIASVAAGIQPPPQGAERLYGLSLPGFANAHSHAFHRALRGTTQFGRGSFWTWRERMYEAAGRLDPESYLALARATFAEMALAGITAVGEFHYLHHAPDGTPYDDPNAMGEAVVEAARQAGIRLTLLDTCYLHGGIGRPPEDSQRRFADADVAGWAERAEALKPAEGARVGAAIHSVRAVDPESAAKVAAWANERSLPLHAHVSEQPAENRDAEEAWGRSPAAVLAEAGAVSERFTAVHLTHPREGDLPLLRGATCCLCPTTERDLADGVGPASEMREAGLRIALGSDSHAVVDPFEEARAVELDERLIAGERGRHDAAGLLRAATADGHGAIGWPEAGRLEPGAIADLVTVSLDSVRLAGTTPETALEAAVFAASAADVREVVAGGRRIVADGRHAEIDVAAELTAAIRRLYA